MSNSEKIQVTLTAEELQMLEAKREEKRLAEEAAKSAEELKREKEIKEIKELVTKALAYCDARMKAAEELFKGFSSPWKFVVVEEPQEVRVYGYEYTETYPNKVPFIRYGDSENFVVEIKEHQVYSDWGRKKNNGFKMFLSGKRVPYKMSNRAYSSSKTVMNKVNELIEEHNAKVKLEKEKRSFLETSVELLRGEFPGATIEVKNEWVVNKWDRNRSGEEANFIYLSLENGVQIKYRVYESYLSRSGIKFPKVEEESDFRRIMSQINF